MHNLNATLMLFYTIPKKPRIFKIEYPFLLLYKLYLNLYRCKSKSRALSLPVCKTLCQLYYTLSTLKFTLFFFCRLEHTHWDLQQRP